MVVKKIEVTKTGDRSEKDFYAELDKAKRRPGCGGCGGCLFVILVLLLLLVLGGATVVAKSGLLDIPLISPLVYKEDPMPRRTVEVGSATSLDQLLESRAATIETSGGALTLTEGDLTAAMREPGDSGKLVLKRGQIALDPDSAELYGQVPPGDLPGNPVTVRITLEPRHTGSIEATSVQVGYLDLPIGVARFLARYILGLDIGSTTSLAAYGVSDVTLGSGEMTISFARGGVNLQGLGATAGLAVLEALEAAGIDPQQLSGELTPDTIAKIKSEFDKLSPQQQTELEQAFEAFPQLKLLDQSSQASSSEAASASEDQATAQ